MVHAPDQRTVNRVVTVALVCVLFDGGMHIGWSRFRAAARPDRDRGGGRHVPDRRPGPLLLHVAFGFELVRLAAGRHRGGPNRSRRGVLRVGPTRGHRPQRHHPGRRVRRQRPGGDRLDGQPDRCRRSQPGRSSPTSAAQFALQMLVGAAVGVVGGRALLWFMRRVPLPSEGLYPLRTLAGRPDALRARHPGPRFGIPRRVRRGHRSGRRTGPVQTRRSNASTPPWPDWARSWRSPCSDSPSTWAVLARHRRGASRPGLRPRPGLGHPASAGRACA